MQPAGPTVVAKTGCKHLFMGRREARGPAV